MKRLLRTPNRQMKGIRDFLDSKYANYDPPRAIGEDLLNDPLDNRSNAFNLMERQRNQLEGLLPPKVFSIEEQKKLYMDELRFGEAFYTMMKKDSNIPSDDIRKFRFLQSLQNENETLFYRLLIDNIEEVAPIIYTPTVGWFCQHFSRNFRRPRGMFITREHRGRIAQVLKNWHQKNVDAIVVTDGSRILGLGDQGIGGMGISIGKMNLYVAAGGFHPKKIMPCIIDVGTNNQDLINDPYYLGIKEPRLEGEEYYSLIDEFVGSVFATHPNSLLQFEDFQFKHASNLLNRYRDEYLIFNDDIQGTAAIVLAGILGALKVQNLQNNKITELTFAIAGAGNAARGIVTMLKNLIKRYGLTEEEASRRFFVLGEEGLFTLARPGLDDFLKQFSRPEVEYDKLSLKETVRIFKPNVLIGATGRGKLFTPEILTLIGENQGEFAPIIFPLSNPTANSECTAEECFTYTKGRAIFGSGSPFPSIVHEGKTIKSNLTNNVYIYPGLAFGAFLGKAMIISDAMVVTAAESLTDLLTQKNIDEKSIFPDLKNIREISTHIAAKVIEQAQREGVLTCPIAKAYLLRGMEDLKNYIRRKQFNPNY